MSRPIYTLYSDASKRIILTLRRDAVSEGFTDEDGCLRIVSITSGSGNITYDEATEHFSEGDTFIIDNGKRFFISEANDVEILFMKFSLGDFIDTDYKVLQKEMLGSFLSRIESSVERLRGIHINTKRIVESMYMIEEELSKESSIAYYVVKAYVALILALAMQYLFDELDDGGVNRCPHYKSIKNVLNYINDNLSEKLTLDELTRVAGMGKTGFSVAFKNVTGMTVWEYIINARIEFAANYLAEKRDDFNITEIAMMSGFNNAAHFTRIFKKIKGNTPSEFKNSSGNPCF